MPVQPVMMEYYPSQTCNATIKQSSQNSVTTTSGGNVFTTLTTASVTGSTILVFACIDTQSGAIPLICSDPTNGAYTNVVSYTDTGNEAFKCFIKQNATSIATTAKINVSFSANSTYRGIAVVEVANVNATSLIANSVQFQNNLLTGVNAINSGYVYCGSGPSILIGFTNNDANGTQAAIGAGYTLIANVWTFAGGSLEYRKSTNPGQAAAIFTSTGVDSWATFLVALKST